MMRLRPVQVAVLLRARKRFAVRLLMLLENTNQSGLQDIECSLVKKGIPLPSALCVTVMSRLQHCFPVDYQQDWVNAR